MPFERHIFIHSTHPDALYGQSCGHRLSNGAEFDKANYRYCISHLRGCDLTIEADRTRSRERNRTSTGAGSGRCVLDRVHYPRLSLPASRRHLSIAFIPLFQKRFEEKHPQTSCSAHSSQFVLTVIALTAPYGLLSRCSLHDRTPNVAVELDSLNNSSELSFQRRFLSDGCHYLRYSSGKRQTFLSRNRSDYLHCLS